MASALASPPPPFSFGSSDLKRNARRFLERALVISALAHLVAVGVFRAAYRRFAPPSEVEVAPPTRWNPPVDIGPRVIPLAPIPTAPSQPEVGIYVPTNVVDIPSEPFDPARGVASAAPGPVSNAGPGTEVSIPGGLPPPPPARPFTYAEIPPVAIVAPLPAYPDFAREALIEGTVIVRVVVGTDGLPRDPIAVSGPKALQAAAVEGVKRWKFRPGLTSGQPVQVSVDIPVLFRL